MSAPTRDGSPVADIAAVVAGPVLAMLMVGSLVWFLVDVLYAGPHPGRLLWCLSFFVIGAVLTARIAIELGRSKANLYSAALGGAVLLAVFRFVEGVNPLLAVGLIALTWWLTDRLTHDSTHLDEDRRASGRGLLAASGLGAVTAVRPDPAAGADDAAEAAAAKRRKKDPAGPAGWWARLSRYRAARRLRPHTPGTWVLGFGLAALPVFALGQSLVPAADAATRRATLAEAAVFVASGLGLLVTTTLLGLRRYLDQRDARVPPAVTLGWLGLGGGLTLAVVVVAALLPRPHSETPLVRFSRGDATEKRAASQHAVLRDDQGGKGEGAQGTKAEADKNGTASGKGPPGGDGKGQGSGGKEPGKNGSSGGKENGDKGSGGDSKSGKQGERSEGKGEPQGDKAAKEGNTKGQDGKTADGQKTKGGEGKDAAKGGESGSQPEAKSPGPQQRLGEAMTAAGTLLKWVVWVLIAVAVVAGAVWFVLRGLAPFTDWAKNLLAWFRNLFGRRERAAGGSAAVAAPAAPERPPPFRTFLNPFADGSARRQTPTALATYSFAALDAWAWDRGLGRRSGETPAEFAARLEAEAPALDGPAGRAADLATRALYSRAPLPADGPKALAGLWRLMEE